MLFLDRHDAGKRLAHALERYKGRDVVVYALPRGGVVVGVEIAKLLAAPLDLVIARKIGHPENPEYAICAVSEDGTSFCNEQALFDIDPAWLQRETERELKEAKRRRDTYFPDKNHTPALGKVAIIVDDGIATGLTMQAAIASIKKGKPSKLVVAVPVAPNDIVDMLRKQVDEVVLLDEGPFIGAVGAYYSNFEQVSDKEVIDILKVSST